MRPFLCAVLTLAACGGTPPPADTHHPVHVTPTPAASEADTWSGEYTLSGSTGPDGCGEQIVLAAEHVRVDLASRQLFADVVDRTYAIEEVSSDQLRAEGRFTIDVCPDATIFERWTLSRNGEGFAGILESTWPNPSNCAQVCSVQFQIEGAPR